METKYNLKNCEIVDNDLNYINCSSAVNSKKIKHALRQQVKRRRKNTTIAAGNSHLVNKIVNALPSNVSSDFSSPGINNHIAVEETAVTMEEVLSSLPGFGLKSSKRRSIKRLSVAAQLEAGLVDLESPASILAYTSLRALLNRHTFQGLPLLYQRKLAQLLPAVDRQDAATSGLNNEFFARACQEWRKRLSEGEFTPENQHRLKLEAEKDKSKLDPWKLKHFEPIWEEKRELFMIQCGLHSLNNEQKFSNSLTSLSKLRSSSDTNLERNLSDFPHCDDSIIKTKAEKLELSISRNSFDKSSSVNDHNIPKFDFGDRILESDEVDDSEEKVGIDHGVGDIDEDEINDDEDDFEDDGDENDNDIEDVSEEDSNDEIEDNDDSDGELSDENINKFSDNGIRNYNTGIGDENDADDYGNNYHDEIDGNYYHENDDDENDEIENDHEDDDIVEDGNDEDDHGDDDEDDEEEDQYDDKYEEEENNSEEDEECNEKIDANSKNIVNASRATKRSHENDDNGAVNKQAKTRISVLLFDEEAQHCKAIMLSNSKILRSKKPSFQLPFAEKMAIDCVEESKKEECGNDDQKELKEENTDKDCSPNSDSAKFSCNPNIDDFSLKPSENFTFENQHELDLEYQDSEADTKHSINSNLKFETKDKFFNNDITMEINEKEKMFASANLNCESRDPLNSLNNEADNNLTSELSEVIEIDHETLQRIHDLEVQGEMQEAYEEISHCSEEIIYPSIDIGMISSEIKIAEKSDITEMDQDQKINNCVSAKSQEEAFQEANNYVCSEMLESDWSSGKKENEGSNDKEDLVHWSFADAASLSDVNELNVAVTTSDTHEDSGLIMNKKSTSSDENEENFENSDCFTMPSSNLPPESVQISTPVTSCLMKNIHTTQSSSIITIPQLQAIRFVQTNFQTTVERSLPDTTSKDPTICTYIQSTSNSTQNQSNISNNVMQNKVCRNQEDIYNEISEESESQNQTHSIISENLIQQNMQTQSTVLFQQQALLPLASRQIITPIKSQQQSYYPMVMNVPTKSNRCMGTQNSYRSSRVGNREHGNGRSRNTPKEPLGAVNLERSYQICQAVIASSPNRDQLKAHLKPPPGLLIKEKSSGNKSNSQSASSSTSQRNWNSNQEEGAQNKSQGVMLHQIITTSRQSCSQEPLENNPALKGSRNNFEDFDQYVVINKAEANDSIPRASSAPPMPPHVENTSIVHMVHGRPASAGEKPHPALSSKKKENNLKNGKMGINNSHIIHEDDLSYLCRCNIREAMTVCRRCGAFCHDDCITPQFICAMCLLN